MPTQHISEPNPRPDQSLLDDALLQYGAQLETKNYLPADELASIQQFRRAADFIAAAMIFLNRKGAQDNALLQRDLTFDDIKPRLLGHWGTCPGLVMAYTHVNRLIRKHGLDALYIAGPGHGAPAILSCLWLEDSLAPFLPPYTRNLKGLSALMSSFSVPGGFPSHINAETPGSIHEGGELGYALSVAFGAVMDKPDLVACCVVGDGEAETGPTATAWHGYKYIDPRESGAVLPIVHVNGFKISERTLYGCMDDKELVALFTGYGYQPRIVTYQDYESIDNDLAASMDWALSEIRRIQHAARSGNPIVKPRWPVLILRTPKGLSGPKVAPGVQGDDAFIEGSFHSHQVPLPNAKSSAAELAALQDWLRSYKPLELFDPVTGAPNEAILKLVPEEAEKKLGQKPESYRGYQGLDIPQWRDFCVPKTHGPEATSGKVEQKSCTKVVGEYLREVIKKNPKSFRIFSPDELVSNKLDAVLRSEDGTPQDAVDPFSRNFQFDPASRARGGRTIEILSEHTCQGFLQGYTLTGRVGLFPSYEAFLGIVHTMCVQYGKFVKMAGETPWRKDVGSLNYLETSTWTRQEHNGFSHQNPSFIGAILNLKPRSARVYLPPDANCFLSTMAHCLRAKNYVNLMVGSKQPTPVWLSQEEADRHCIAGASVWKFASTDDGVDPDVVLVGIGVELTFEVIAAAALLRSLLPELRVRVINIVDLMILGPPGSHPHALTEEAFDTLFTKDRGVVFNYHGYPAELKGLLFGRPLGFEGEVQRGGGHGGRKGRVTIGGYIEEGTTTSPFDMLLCNKVSRFDVATYAVASGALVNPKVAVRAHEVGSYLKHLAQKERDYILSHGEDSPGIFDTPKFN